MTIKLRHSKQDEFKPIKMYMIMTIYVAHIRNSIMAIIHALYWWFPEGNHAIPALYWWFPHVGLAWGSLVSSNPKIKINSLGCLRSFRLTFMRILSQCKITDHNLLGPCQTYCNHKVMKSCSHLIVS